MLNKKRYHYSAYSLIFIMFFECFVLCTLNNDVYSMSTNSDEEIIRRRKIVESYLSKKSHSEKDWIETYHMDMPENFISSQTEMKESYTSQVGQRISSETPTQSSFELPLQQYFQETGHSVKTNNLFFSKEYLEYLSIQSGLSESNKITSEEIARRSSIFEAFKPQLQNVGKDSDSIVKTTSETKRTGETIEKSAKTDKMNSVSHSSSKFLCYKNDTALWDPHLRSMKSESVLVVNQSKDINRLKVNNLENSLGNDLDNKKFLSKEREILKSEYKPVENQYFHTENIVFNKNVKKTDSVCKAKSIFNEDFFTVTNVEFCKTSNFKGGIEANDFTIKATEQKKSKMLKKREGDISESVSNNNIALHKIFENAESNELLIGSEAVRKKQLVSSFMSTLYEDQRNWIETYHNYKEVDPKKNENFKLIRGDSVEFNSVTNKYSKLHSQERFYIIRWINKLKNKYKENFYTSPLSVNALNIPLSVDILNNLEELTKESDVVSLDILISSLISNATLHNSYASSFEFHFLPLEFNLTYIFVAALLVVIVFYMNISVYLKLLFIAVAWHGYKLYQEKIAEKHNIISKVPSSYCESILNQESGIFAHFKEYFRHYWHDEDCKKLYSATMVDPSAEISFPIILADLGADVVFQVFKPFGRKINNFFKDLTYDLSYSQQFSIFVLLIIILIFCLMLFAVKQKYRISFPFFMGSVEPTKFCAGSKVEDITLDEEKYFLQNYPVNCDTQIRSKNCSGKNRIEMERNILCITNPKYPSVLSSEILLNRPCKGRRVSI